ncbi:hypothetical protein SteCoe_25082 [Stentor coeruleus]|uniref:Histone H3-K79 methyltransferase n=1 Tax=Stentor coeruleus TaxID=5963 RepID=A0A1R2BG00_9CILI|nr:hypothetical protein SteCoe_25082 [Stentor coeruleus]
MLIENQWVYGEEKEEGFIYYTMKIEDPGMELVVTVEPYGEKSDPDLYIINSEDNPDLLKYTWKSTFFGTDTIQKFPGDQDYVNGIYTIGIYNAKPSQFRLKYYQTKVPILLQASNTIEIQSCEYFAYKIQHKSRSRLEIIIENGRSAIFGSFAVRRPKLEWHDASSGYWEKCQGYIEIDPFPSFPFEFIPFHMPGNKIQEGNTKTRLCIDSKNNSNSDTLYLRIDNLEELPRTFLITCQEIPIENLIPKDIEIIYKNFQEIYKEVDSYSISQNDRSILNLNHSLAFTYGEVDFFNYLCLLETARPQPGEILWDLGCGVGKSMISASLAFPFLTIKGIEYLPTVFTTCEYLCSQFPNIKVFCGDIKTHDWSEADIVYMSSLCFLDDLIEAIFAKSQGMKKGSRVLTLKELPIDSNWALSQYFRVLMSWGHSDCFLYTKIS